MVLGIYGSGGAGRGVKEIADLLNKWSEIIFIDDTVPMDTFKGIKRMPFEKFKKNYDIQNSKISIAIGEPEDKFLIYKKVKECGYGLDNVIHPVTYISSSAKIGEGVIIQFGSMVGADATIGNNVILGQQVGVGHDAVVEDHSQLSAHSTIAGGCYVGSRTYIGIGTAVREKTRIGRNSIISMGSIVQKDIPDEVIAMGNPARVIRMRNGERVFG